MESKIYTGKIIISTIENFQPPDFSIQDFHLLEKDILFIHYPDCQQLIIFLPKPVSFYNSIIWTLGDTESTWMNQRVENMASGPAKLVIDTLSLPDGDGVIILHKNETVIHKIIYVKYPDEAVKLVNQEEVKPGDYRDGMGRILPQEDMIFRERSIEQLKDRFISKLTYHPTGRDGYILFAENDKSIRFDYEMGGGNCLIFILIPTQNNWEEKTGFPIAERDRIIEHLAHMTHRDYIGGAPFEIKEDCIVFYKNKRN